MPRGALITKTRVKEVQKLVEKGLTNTEIADKLGISTKSVWRIKKDIAPIPEEDLQLVKDRLRGRFLVATDTLLESALADAEKETPYRRMIMAGIAHDHYLRTLMFDRGQNSAGVLTQILIMVDASQRGTPNPFTQIDVTPVEDGKVST